MTMGPLLQLFIQPLLDMITKMLTELASFWTSLDLKITIVNTTGA